VSWSSPGNKTYTVGHGLNAKPSLAIAKTRNGSDNWVVYTNAIDGSYDELIGLNTTAAKTDSGGVDFTSSVFNPYDTANGSGQNGIAYCFSPVEGYSAMGSYVGNSSADGTFVYTGFKPKFVLVKNTTSTQPWQINDAVRNPHNLTNLALHPNTTQAEQTYTTAVLDILSNGFKFRNADGHTNNSGNTYIYLAFAEHPFKNARAR
jgi:hypothetical protein